MKNVLALLAGIIFLGTGVISVQAAKPSGNLAGSEKIPWHYSAYPDTTSKLIVNQPNGNTVVTMTGDMQGLIPNTTYTVMPSDAWEYLTGPWNVTGSYEIIMKLVGHDYPATLNLIQEGTAITGGSLNSELYGLPFNVYGGWVDGDLIKIEANQGNLLMTMFGVINPDGSISPSTMVYPNWNDEGPGEIGAGWWWTTKGYATGKGVLWPGPYGNLSPLTFTTDALGSGSWHVNLTNDDLTGYVSNLSIWIFEGETPVLYSEKIEVVKN